MSIGTSLRCDHPCPISAFDTLCDGRFKAPTTYAFLTLIFSGWWLEDIVDCTNLNITETDDNIALALSNVHCLSFRFRAFTKSDVTIAVSEPESRREFSTVVYAPCVTLTGVTCRTVRTLSGFVEFWFLVGLTLTWCWFSSWSIVWYFRPQLWTRHFIWRIHSFSKWVFEKQFLHIFSLVAKSVLSFADFFLNSLHSINRCLPLQSRHVRVLLLFLRNFCSSGSFSFSFSFLSELLFMKFENIFLLKLYFGCCWCFDDAY